MLELWQFMLLGGICLLFLIIWLKQRIEFFEDGYKAYNETIPYKNTGPDIQDHHPMQVSILEDIKSKYTKAYNYELENTEYEVALRNTFNVKKTTTPLCISPAEWSVVEPVNLTLNDKIKSAYKHTIEYIKSTMKMSNHFQLPDNLPTNLNNIQMVHDVLVAYQSHKTLPSYLLTLQFVFYREAKYHAKDVGMTVRVDKERGTRWKVTIMDIWINGVIFEDKIALFPVVASDPYNTNINLSSANFIDKHPSKYIKNHSKYCASNNLDKDNAMQCIDVLDMRALDDDRLG